MTSDNLRHPKERIKAIIADDEAPLRNYLKSQLARVWPELVICAEAQNGMEAVRAVMVHKPHIAFLDIRMPGLSGLQAAEEIAGTCRIVFVTAYDDYAVAAFEKEAVDYLLKPVTLERLSRTVDRLKQQLGETLGPPTQMVHLAQELIRHITTGPVQPFLQWLHVQHGDGVQLIAVQDVIYFKAGDKYTAIQIHDKQFLIRKSIRELATELDPDHFRQIHRSTIVNVSQIARVSRSITGRGVIRLKDRPETLTVSRRYLSLFKQM